MISAFFFFPLNLRTVPATVKTQSLDEMDIETMCQCSEESDQSLSKWYTEWSQQASSFRSCLPEQNLQLQH
jgi:hypothetical protein